MFRASGPRRSQVSLCVSPKNLSSPESQACHLVSRAGRPHSLKTSWSRKLEGGAGETMTTPRNGPDGFSACVTNTHKGKRAVRASGILAMVL